MLGYLVAKNGLQHLHQLLRNVHDLCKPECFRRADPETPEPYRKRAFFTLLVNPKTLNLKP